MSPMNLLDSDRLDGLLQTAQAQRGRLAAIARGEGLSPEDAVDCVQDALCTLIELVQSGQLEFVSDSAPLLTTMVRNAARNDRRRHFRSRPHDAIDALHLVDRDLPFPDDLMARAVDQLRLRACVAELCEIQRAVVTLRILEERPGEDVAQLLGISKNHAAVLLHRARSSLRACMTGDHMPGTASSPSPR
jgi:RNA polymerase sigma-70 factor (ECF subfamily)